MIKRTLNLILILLLIFCLAGCGNNDSNTASQITDKELCETAKQEIIELYSDRFDLDSSSIMSKDFLSWVQTSFGNDSILNLYNCLKENRFSKDTWYSLTGNTFTVLKCYYKGALDKTSPNYRSNIKVLGDNDGNAVIRMTGDFSLADNWKIAPMYDSRNKGVKGILSEDTINLLKSADVTLVNNEFCYSDRGSPIKNKMYTFRASPKRVSIFNELGVDIVSLANNHAYDYGADAFSDTMQTLKNADIAYIGGGENITEASLPYYFIVDGRMIGFAAATKAEKYRLTPEATENSSGVLLTYNPAKYIEVLKKASLECDYLVAYVHWGLEGSHEIEDGLREMGASFIDAGADIVVGAHAHLLQGIEFYNGKPIVFNLGNFLFNAKTMDSGILELTIDPDNKPSFKFIPCIQSNCFTEVLTDDQAKRVIDFMRSMSNGVSFDENGVFKAEQE